jgi:hypothetical protein
MKILERYDQTKTVEAWGETWTVPEGTTHLEQVSKNDYAFILARVHNAKEGMTFQVPIAKVDDMPLVEDVYVGDQNESR